MTYGRCEILNWPEFNNEIHALPEQIKKQDAAMTYAGSFYIDKKLATGRFEKCEADLRHCTCPCLLYTSPSPRDKRQSRMPSSA